MSAQGMTKQNRRARPRTFENDEPPGRKARGGAPAFNPAFNPGFFDGGAGFMPGQVNLAGGLAGQPPLGYPMQGGVAGFDAGFQGNGGAQAVGADGKLLLQDRSGGQQQQQQGQQPQQQGQQQQGQHLPEPSALHQLYMQQLLLAQKEHQVPGAGGGQAGPPAAGLGNFMNPSGSRMPERADQGNPAVRFQNRFPQGPFMDQASWGAGFQQAGLRIIRGDEAYEASDLLGGHQSTNPTDGGFSNLQGMSGLPLGTADASGTGHMPGVGRGMGMSGQGKEDPNGFGANRSVPMGNWQMQTAHPGPYPARPQALQPGRHFVPPYSQFGTDMSGAPGMHIHNFGGIGGPPQHAPKKPRARMLTAQDAVEIYKHRPSKMPPGTMLGMHAAALAIRFHVAANTVRDIWGRRTWVKATQSLWTEEETRSYQESLEASKKSQVGGPAQDGNLQQNSTPSP